MEKSISVTHVMTGCQLKLAGHPFEIDLWTTTLSSLANMLDMDWLSRNLAEVLCFEKSVRIPIPNGDVLIVQGGKAGVVTQIISSI